MCINHCTIMINYLDKTIKVNIKTKNRLDENKIHPREPYDEVINRLLDFFEKQPLTSDRK